MKHSVREELAWAAGFFDGEGYIGYGIFNDQRLIRFSVSQLHREPLDRFSSAVLNLGNTIYKKNNGKRFIYQFECAKFENVQAIVGMLWEFLSPIKRIQAKKAFDGYNKFGRDRELKNALKSLNITAEQLGIA